jgi:magnesium transporter
VAVNTYHLNDRNIVWTDISEPTQQELEDVSRKYGLNAYTLIDSLDPDHLPKYEEHQDINFIIVRAIHDDHTAEQNVRSLSTKIAIFYNDKFLVTAHRCSQPIIESARKHSVETGKAGSVTVLAIQIAREALHTFEAPALRLSAKIESIESRLFLKRNLPPDLIKSIYVIKSKAGVYKKLLLLSNEVVRSIRANHDERPALQDLRDLHTKLLLLNEQLLDDAHNLMNIYLSLSAGKTNDVMKVLTIFSVFFMPITFIAGIYGMNFRFMPELDFRYGYPLALALMAVVSIVIFVWFRRKRWL